MSAVSRILFAFISMWIIIYMIAYYVIMSPDNSDSSNLKGAIPLKVNENIATTDKPKIVSKSVLSSVEVLVNPFVSNVCQSKYSSGWSSNKLASVVLVSRNANKNKLVSVIHSIFQNSGDYLHELILVDDWSDSPISAWGEWIGYDTKLKFIRPDHRLGSSAAKRYGAAKVSSSSNAIVFAEADVVVSENWLLPLLDTLERFPNAIVYPTIDVLYEESGNYFGYIQADNLVGSFDWAMNFRWEHPDHIRMPLIADDITSSGPDMEITSPAAPEIFAIRKDFYMSLGGIEDDFGMWGQDNIEFSIRTWLCGGVVIRQPCSRVAYKYSNLFENSPVGEGVTQSIVDHNVMSLAERYFRPKYKEVVFQARFTGRVPYSVDLSSGDRFTVVMNQAKGFIQGSCQSIDWFLTEVFPGLIKDIPLVQESYHNYLADGMYLNKALNLQLSQYTKTSSDIYMDSAEVSRLHALTETADEKAIQNFHDEFIPQKVSYIHPRVGVKEAAEKAADDQRQRFQHLIADHNRAKELESLKDKENDIKQSEIKSNNHEVEVIPPKLPEEEIKKESQEVIEDHNKPPPTQDTNSFDHIQLPDGMNHHLIEYPDVYTSQKQYANGELPDPGAEKSSRNCNLNKHPNGELLSRIIIHDDTSTYIHKYRIFCGIYTMEKNHNTNVDATRSTWAKRCDGFMAFSTITDFNIPSYNITHEGPEEYNNMWQKSRSIWKFIANNYLDSFDFFLLGGDDMFYIIENLRYYLGSNEIHELKESSNGLYFGRRFFPPHQEVFNSGGAGYLIDTKSLQILKDNLDSPICHAHQVGFWEDVNIANCLRQSAGIIPYDTRDDLKRERFHPFLPGSHLTYRIPKTKENWDWYPKYNPELKEGYECCSENSISFHYSPADTTKQLHSYLYHCDNKEKSEIYGKIA